MKAMLMKAAPHPMYYYRSGMWIGGPHPELLGDVSELRGDVSELQGDVTGLRGDVSGLWGDLDACGITDAERENGIAVATLVRSEP